MQLIKYLGFRDFSKRENVLFALKRRLAKDTRKTDLSMPFSAGRNNTQGLISITFTFNKA